MRVFVQRVLKAVRQLYQSHQPPTLSDPPSFCHFFRYSIVVIVLLSQKQSGMFLRHYDIINDNLDEDCGYLYGA